MDKQILLFILFVLILIYLSTYFKCDKKIYAEEHYDGALQSLYSNDGIQDAYLTIENDRTQYDPYKYWRGISWDLPTRNLNTLIYYPYLYEYYIDKYGVLWPYW